MKLRPLIIQKYREGKNVQQIESEIRELGRIHPELLSRLHYVTLARYIKRIIYVYNRRLQSNIRVITPEADERLNCYNCGTSRRRQNLYEGNNHLYCRNCFNRRFVICASCNTAVYRAEVKSYNSQLLCFNCYNEQIPIQEYSYSPREFNFVKNKWENTQYLGIELEVESKNSDDTIESQADDLKAYLKDLKVNQYYYLKYDGSLSDGFEVVSHPFTFQAKSKLKFNEVLKWLSKNKFVSYDSGNCGLHIHLTADKMTNMQKQKLRLFFYKCRHILADVSFRKGKNTSYCQFEQSLNKTTIKKNQYADGRYWALNFNSTKPTIEFRLFRGTLNYKRFLANLTFCEALHNYCKNISISFLYNNAEQQIWDNFMQYVKREYNYLFRFYKKEGIPCV